MSELIITRIRDTATKLGLAHLAETLPDLIKRAEDATMGYVDFLDLALGEEAGVKDGRRFRNALKLSGLPHHKTLDDFDFAFQPDLDVRKIRDLATLAFLQTHSNIALLGPPGVGKSHLAIALAVAACQTGYSIYFTSLDDLVGKLRLADGSGAGHSPSVDRCGLGIVTGSPRTPAPCLSADSGPGPPSREW